ncbi:MAG TPA: EAL domain-containing protein [Allosphingosinicella sp.]|nr:EAL domain-containing protein [Allosphingosinicella sp.]
MFVIVSRISNGVLSVCAGVSSFLFTLAACLLLTSVDQQLAASIAIGLLALLVVWIASEKPNSRQARAVSALIDRLLAVETGDLASPAPAVLRNEMPALASAVDALFKQVQSNIENVHVMAMYDPVTSLPNRVHFKREADRILHARKDADTLAVLFIDLDGFKEVNDSLGHAQGDQTLALVAARLRRVVKAEVENGSLLHPLIARLAGDEFTLLFPSLGARGEAERIARGVLAALCEPFEMAGQKIEMGASIGIALCPDHGADLTSLMKAADIAMYHAKDSGRSQVCVYDAALAAAFDEKARIEKALRQAVARKEFELAFHPQLSVRTGAVVAGEALVRWNHPIEGVKLPKSFIPVAEESGLILEIGGWVIEQAALAIARWQAAGMPQRVTINISPRQIERADFFTQLRATMASAGAPLSMLELEFTETLAMRCNEALLQGIAALRADGVTIAIDDFGSGYSNLARMKDMAIDRVKIDPRLVSDIDSSDAARTIVSSVIHLVHGLGAEVVGEGVERMEQYDVLRVLGCDFVQGFAFADPMSEPDFISWVTARSDTPRRARTA